MAEQERNYASLGMLFGIAISGGLGVVLYAITNQPAYIAFAGAGAGVGLAIGAGIDRAKRKPGEKQ